jgi:[ribosomal protein S5]-alanine N-acetyltransferase
LNYRDHLPKRLDGKNIFLRPFTENDISSDYLSWLNDPEVNLYSRRRYFSSDRESAKKFFLSLGENEGLFAICRKEDAKHVGNIQFGPIDTVSSIAEIRIIVGDRAVWGKGVGTDAIEALMKYLFHDLKIRRLEANSCNPAFIRCVEKLGWIKEGTLRKRFRAGDEYLDYEYWGLLREEAKI